jgi:uncharacterized RmlC-like cupin family protein
MRTKSLTSKQMEAPRRPLQQAADLPTSEFRGAQHSARRGGKGGGASRLSCDGAGGLPGSQRRGAGQGPRGLIVSIAECEPGNGPGLHRHLNTVENFFCLSGRFEIAWGDRGEHRLVLEPLDMISVPRGENRSFRNVSNELGRLLVMIVPETDEQVDPVSYAPSLAKEIEDEYGKTALAGLQKIGFRFEDESGA